MLLWSLIASADNWPQFRGPGSSGVSETATPPTKWSETDNVAWVATIPGRGWSSPIVCGSTLFVTSAVTVDGSFKEPSTGIFGNDYAAELAEQGLSDEEVMDRVVTRDIELASETEAIRYMLYAVAVESGEILWEREAHRGKPFGGRHRKNTYASETPATDGEHVYAYFGNVGLFCYSMTGELVPVQKHHNLWCTRGLSKMWVLYVFSRHLVGSEANENLGRNERRIVSNPWL